jgi:hypothetical protein
MDVKGFHTYFPPQRPTTQDADPDPNVDPDHIVSDLVATEFPSHVHEHAAGNVLGQLSDGLRGGEYENGGLHSVQNWADQQGGQLVFHSAWTESWR